MTMGKRTELHRSGSFPKFGEKKKPTQLSEETKKQIGQIIQAKQQAVGQLGGMSDNSNTQFATLAMWVGRKHGLPVDGSLARLEKRFRETQSRNGSWGYIPMGLPAGPGGPGPGPGGP